MSYFLYVLKTEEGRALTAGLLWGFQTYSIDREIVHRKNSKSPRMSDLPGVHMLSFHQLLIADSIRG